MSSSFVTIILRTTKVLVFCKIWHAIHNENLIIRVINLIIHPWRLGKAHQYEIVEIFFQIVLSQR
jgi:hypothetical protein